MTQVLNQSVFSSEAQESSLYNEFYRRYDTPDSQKMSLLGSRVLHFDAPSSLRRNVHFIAHEAIGHTPISRARPLHHKTGKVYEHFTYDPSGFQVFTTDGQTITQWQTKKASVQLDQIVDGVSRPFMRDGVPVYATDVDIHLELQHDENERAWLRMRRFGNEGTLMLADKSVGWILDAETSQLERAFALSVNLASMVDYQHHTL